MKNEFITLFLIVLFCCITAACFATSEQPPVSTEQNQLEKSTGCLNCHKNVTLDENHRLECQTCHQGNGLTDIKEKAHANMLFHPAHPDNVRQTCGECHKELVEKNFYSAHFTLKNAVNLVRRHFGADDQIQDLTQIPISESLDSPLKLADDMLRRRCLRCHLYSSGDPYSAVHRGTGCAACHLQYTGGKLTSHEFLRLPTDRQCLSCHYGNTVGADYYGRFEHDFNNEYRTPYTTTEDSFRPYGVEYHQLSSDIHQQKGLSCIDCHSGQTLMGETTETNMSCISCHDSQTSSPQTLIAKHTKTKHTIPQLRDPAHKNFGDNVACTVCHAGWSFNDDTTHLLLSMSDDYDPWANLTIQGNAELENLLDHNLYSEEDELDPRMTDMITHSPKNGVWYQGYTQRRWEDIIVRRDTDGVIKVFRPLLNLHLSYVNHEDTVIFDDITGKTSGYLPYTPHTIGPAGLYFRQRFSHLIPENLPKSSKK